MKTMQTREQHMEWSRQAAIAAGLVDCIHLTANWQRRVDELYRLANETGAEWWHGCVVGLLADGRMVVTGDVVSVFEVLS